MSLNYGNVMRELYGEKALLDEEWLELERREKEAFVSIGGDIDTDDDEFDYDVYDDEEYDYDSDDEDY